MNFCEQLTKLRKEKGISQEALAEVIGVSRQAISKWETGATQPEMSNILRLCEIFDVSPSELLGHEETQKSVSSEVSSETENDCQIKGHRGRRKLASAGLAVCCIFLGMILGFLIRSNSSGEDNRQEIPIDFSVNGYDLFSESFSDAMKTFRLNFTPNVTNPEYNYRIIITNDKGISKEFDANAGAGGVYTGTFQVATGYSHYMISVSMEVGENTYSDALIKIWNISETGYSWEEIEE